MGSRQSHGSVTLLERHSAAYLLARGLPGIVNFISISVYTRLLSPEGYGRYAAVVAGVSLLNVVFFQWVRLSLLRFLPAYSDDRRPLLQGVLFAFSWMIVLTGVIGGATALLWPDTQSRSLALLAIPLLWAEAWYELNLELTRSQLQPVRYGLLAGIRAVTSVVLGAVFVLAGLEASGPLLGLLAGSLLAQIATRREWLGIRPVFDRVLLEKIVRYGLPLTATFALSFIVTSSDRFMILYFMDEGSLGAYAAGYDLTHQTLGLLMATVNLAAWPLAARALEVEGVQAARRQVRQNGNLLMAIAVPATVGLIAVAPQVADLVIGESFRDEAAGVIPWVAVATLLNGIRAYHYDLAFQLGKKTGKQVWVMLGAASLNFLLNVMCIPRYGLLGAAWATLAAYGFALGLSVLLGQGIFPVPTDWLALGCSGVAAAIMVLVLNALPALPGPVGLVIHVALGAGVYGSAFVVLARLRESFR